MNKCGKFSKQNQTYVDELIGIIRFNHDRYRLKRILDLVRAYCDKKYEALDDLRQGKKEGLIKDLAAELMLYSVDDIRQIRVAIADFINQGHILTEGEVVKHKFPESNIIPFPVSRVKRAASE